MIEFEEEVSFEVDELVFDEIVEDDEVSSVELGGGERSAFSTDVPLLLRIAGSNRTAPATGIVRTLGMGYRIGRGVMTLLGSVVLAALFLPIPLMHLAGIPIVLAGVFFATRRVRSAKVLRSARGTCPSCGEDTSCFVGFGGTPYKLPLKTSCTHCARSLVLEER